MSHDSQQSVVNVRGRDFPLPTLLSGADGSGKVMQAAILALYALEDPRVDVVLRPMKLTFIWPNGKCEPLYEEITNE